MGSHSNDNGITIDQEFMLDILDKFGFGRVFCSGVDIVQDQKFQGILYNKKYRREGENKQTGRVLQYVPGNFGKLWLIEISCEQFSGHVHSQQAAAV